MQESQRFNHRHNIFRFWFLISFIVPRYHNSTKGSWGLHIPPTPFVESLKMWSCLLLGELINNFVVLVTLWRKRTCWAC